MDPQAVLNLGASPSRRSFAGHVLAAGVYVFIFGALAYLTFLSHGGIAGQLLLVYVSTVPLTIGIAVVMAIASAREKLSAHHAIAGCLGGVLFCGIAGLWFTFAGQIVVTIFGSLALIWVTRYSPAAQFLAPPSLSDIAGSTPLAEHRTARTAGILTAAALLLVGGIGLTLLAAIGQMERPGGLTIRVGG